jgi:hypothetical protein
MVVRAPIFSKKKNIVLFPSFKKMEFTHVYITVILTRADFQGKNTTISSLKQEKIEICISLNRRNPVIAVLFQHFVIFV